MASVHSFCRSFWLLKTVLRKSNVQLYGRFQASALHQQGTSPSHTSGSTPRDFDNRIKAADIKLQSLSAQMREKFECLKLAHTKLIVEFGEEVVDPRPTSEAWLCALENLDPFDEAALIEYFSFLAEKKQEQEQEKEKKQLERAYEKLKEDENKIMLFNETTMTRFCHGNMVYAMMNGPHVVIDMSFSPNLGSRHPRTTTKIVADCLRISKSYRQPFHIHLCGVMEDRKDRDVNVGGIDRTPVSISSHSYLDFYAKENLVYLTSDATQSLERFSFEDVYIIGGLATTVTQRLTYERAKADGIRMARLPLEHINVNPRTDLPATEVFQILLLALETNSDWQKVFSNIESLWKKAGKLR